MRPVRTRFFRVCLMLLLKVGLTIALVMLLSRKVSLPEIANHLVNLDRSTAIASFCILGVIHWLCGFRWHVASRRNLPLISCVRFTWVSQFYSLLLPSALTADVAKGLGIAASGEKHQGSEIFASIALDRISGLGWMIVFGFAACTFLPELSILNRSSAGLATLIATVSLVGASRLCAATLAMIASLARTRRVEGLITRLKDVSQSTWLQILALGFLIQIVNVIFYWVTLRAVGGMEPLTRMALYACLLNLALLLPVTIAGIGLRDHLSIAFLRETADENSAVAFSMLILMVSMAHGLIGLAWQWIAKSQQISGDIHAPRNATSPAHPGMAPEVGKPKLEGAGRHAAQFLSDD